MDDMGNKRGDNIRHAVPFVRQITEDGKPKLEVYRPTTNPIYIWTQVGQTNDDSTIVMIVITIISFNYKHVYTTVNLMIIIQLNQDMRFFKFRQKKKQLAKAVTLVILRT